MHIVLVYLVNACEIVNCELVSDIRIHIHANTYLVNGCAIVSFEFFNCETVIHYYSRLYIFMMVVKLSVVNLLVVKLYGCEMCICQL